MTDEQVREIAEVLEAGLITSSEVDQKGNRANIVDGLFAIAKAINRLALVGERAEKWRNKESAK